MKKEISITVTVDIPEEEKQDLAAKLDTLSLTEGYMVVDTTWRRSLTFLNKAWLGTSSSETPITVFNTVKEAREAIQKTIAHSGGNKYAWQKNNYSIIGVHKANRALRAQQE